jgi:hypothetical protein
MTIKKEAVLAIQYSCNPRILVDLLGSYMDIPFNDPRYERIFEIELL